MSSYFYRMLPSAIRINKVLNIPKSIILAQTYLETGGGTSKLAKYSNNFSGIKYSKYSDHAKLENKIYPKLRYAKYDTVEDWEQDYIRVMSLSYYKDVLKATHTNNIEDDIYQLNKSPYAEDPRYGLKIKNIIEKYDLTKYDKKNNDLNLNVDNMSNDDLKRYALIGLVGVTLINLINNK